MNSNNNLRITAMILALFVGMSAVYGGWMLIADPSGQTLQLPIDLLKKTPFKDYFIPGLILFVMIGFFSLLVTLFTMLKIKHYTWFIILSGCFLIGWLTVELFLNAAFFFPGYHYPLYAIGIALVLTGYFERRNNLKMG